MEYPYVTSIRLVCMSDHYQLLICSNCGMSWDARYNSGLEAVSHVTSPVACKPSSN